MNILSRGLVLGSTLAALALWSLPATASASDASISLRVPEHAVVGEEVTVTAIVSEGGSAVVDGEVSLSYGVMFAGTDDFVVLDTAATDAAGEARLTYQQRAASNGEMRVTYVAPDGSVETFEFSIDVRAGGEQLHRSEAGVEIPFINEWTLISLVAVVWGAVVYSLFQLDTVARLGGADPSPVGDDRGSAPLTLVLLGAAIVLGSGLVTILIRNPSTHFNLGEPGGYARTELAEFGQDGPYSGPGLLDPTGADGRELFIGYGCALCHQVDGGGGVVGPHLRVDEYPDFARDVRRGVDEMPAYGDEVIPERDLMSIHAFLEGATPTDE